MTPERAVVVIVLGTAAALDAVVVTAEAFVGVERVAVMVVASVAVDPSLLASYHTRHWNDMESTDYNDRCEARIQERYLTWQLPTRYRKSAAPLLDEADVTFHPSLVPCSSTSCSLD